MKKVLVALVLVIVFCLAFFSLIGCGDNNSQNELPQTGSSDNDNKEELTQPGNNDDGNKEESTLPDNDNDNKEELAQPFICDIEDAYDNGYITKDDLKSIAYYYNEENAKNGENTESDFVPAPKMPETLSEETIGKIFQTYLDKASNRDEINLDEVYISGYYGTYNGCVIYKKTGSCTSGLGGDPIYYNAYEIDGVIFYHYTPLLAWIEDLQNVDIAEELPTQGTLCGIEEAYANDWITKNDLRAIAYYCNRVRDDSDFVPEPKPVTSLSKKTAQKIKQAYFETVVDANTEATVDDVHIVYCGTYNGCVIFYIIFVSDDGLYPPDCEIDGVTIAPYKPIMAWKEVPLEANS